MARIDGGVTCISSELPDVAVYVDPKIVWSCFLLRDQEEQNRDGDLKAVIAIG